MIQIDSTYIYPIKICQFFTKSAYRNMDYFSVHFLQKKNRMNIYNSKNHFYEKGTNLAPKVH
jgi:hypothetical protein